MASGTLCRGLAAPGRLRQGLTHSHACQLVGSPRSPATVWLHAEVRLRSNIPAAGSWSGARSLKVSRATSQGQGTQQESQPRQRRFKPFAPQTPARQALMDFRHRSHTPWGTLVIQPLTQEWLQSTAELLSISFGESMGYIPAYRHFLKLHIARYLTDHIELIPKTLILIALLLPDSLSGGAWDSADALREDQSSEWGCLVGSAEVSLSASTRSRFLTLNPSKEHGYLSNMAVAEHHRRRGYGRKLLEAAEAACTLSGHRDLSLHLRFQDHAAADLYKQAGYVEEKRDNPLLMLLGQDRRYLMRKTLM